MRGAAAEPRGPPPPPAITPSGAALSFRASVPVSPGSSAPGVIARVLKPASSLFLLLILPLARRNAAFWFLTSPFALGARPWPLAVRGCLYLPLGPAQHTGRGSSPASPPPHHSFLLCLAQIWSEDPASWLPIRKKQTQHQVARSWSPHAVRAPSLTPGCFPCLSRHPAPHSWPSGSSDQGAFSQERIVAILDLC